MREFCVRERWVFDGIQSLLRRHSSSSSKKPMRESSIWHRVVGENSKKKEILSNYKLLFINYLLSKV